jgi:hypothetical protein
MMVYRWQAGEILPDATLKDTLGLAPDADLDAWIYDAYGLPVLEIGKEYYSIRIRGYVAEHDEHCLVEINLDGNYVGLVWCEHWGAMLACVKWALELAGPAHRLTHMTEVEEYLYKIDDSGADAAQVDAKARLIAAGYTAEEVDGLERRYRERQRAQRQRHTEARAAEGGSQS